MKYTVRELKNMDTIEQSWDGDELKIEEDGLRVWLVLPENTPYNGDFVIETLVDGKWIQLPGRWENEPVYYDAMS